MSGSTVDEFLEQLRLLLRNGGELQQLEGGIELRPPHGGLPIGVRASPGELLVTLAAWTQRWPDPWGDDESASEALDLVAAAAFGRVRVHVHARGGKAYRWDVEFAVDGRWQLHESLRTAGGYAFWKRREERVLCNAFDPPEDVVLRESTALPHAPWVGLLERRGGAEARPSELAVDGELDLHPFSPKEVEPLVEAYIEACLDKGITQLRLVHGKGIGNLRRTVHALLERHPAVARYRLGGMGEGSWGATVVDLHPKAPK